MALGLLNTFLMFGGEFFETPARQDLLEEPRKLMQTAWKRFHAVDVFGTLQFWLPAL